MLANNDYASHTAKVVDLAIQRVKNEGYAKISCSQFYFYETLDFINRVLGTNVQGHRDVGSNGGIMFSFFKQGDLYKFVFSKSYED